MTTNHPVKKKGKVLVVDDDNSVGTMLELSLGNSYEVSVSNLAPDIRGLVDAYAPDLILLDANVAGGTALSEGVVSLARSKRLPILFMSVCECGDAFMKALEPDGNALIMKPFTMDALERKIEGLLGPR